MAVSWQGALEAAGFTQAFAASRAPLLSMAAARLAATTTAQPLGAWVVPGRIEVVGKHADYGGGRSLVAAAPRGFAVIAAPRSDQRVRVLDARYATEFELTATDRDRVYPGWTNYVAVVVRRLARNFAGADLGTDIAIASDLPRAAGASSSSALVVGVAHALMARASLAETSAWATAIRGPLDLAAYLSAIENGRSFRTLAGTDGVGTNGGSQDHTAILAARAEAVTAFDYGQHCRLADAPMPTDWRFVIMTSGVHAGKASDAKDRFNHTARVVSAMVAEWNAGRAGRCGTLAEILNSAPDAEDRLRDLLAHTSQTDVAATDLLRRLSHFLAENARVTDAVRAFRTADAHAISEIASASQVDAEEGLGNQVPETRVLAAAARAAGAFAASSFGAGFGGSVWALVEGDDGEAARIASVWSARYRESCPQISHVDWFVARPAPPLASLYAW